MSDLYGRLQWLAYRLAIVNAYTDLPLIFYLLLVKRFEKSNLNETPDMFVFMSKIHGNGNFINLQCTSIRIKHLLQGVGHIKLTPARGLC